MFTLIVTLSISLIHPSLSLSHRRAGCDLWHLPLLLRHRSVRRVSAAVAHVGVCGRRSHGGDAGSVSGARAVRSAMHAGSTCSNCENLISTHFHHSQAMPEPNKIQYFHEYSFRGACFRVEYLQSVDYTQAMWKLLSHFPFFLLIFHVCLILSSTSAHRRLPSAPPLAFRSSRAASAGGCSSARALSSRCACSTTPNISRCRRTMAADCRWCRPHMRQV